MSTVPANFPIQVPDVSLESMVLPADRYAIHVLPFMLEQIKAGKNVPVIAIRRDSDDFGSMLLVRQLIAPPSSGFSMTPAFDSPLPGSTTVVWASTRGKLTVWFKKGHRPEWIAIAGRDKNDILTDLRKVE